MTKKTIKVKGMTCTMCTNTIKNIFDQMDSIDVSVLLSSDKVVVNYDETKYSLQVIAKIIEKLGYTPIIKDNFNDNDKISKSMLLELYLSIILSIPLLIGMFSHIFKVNFSLNGIAQMILAGLIQFGIGKRFYRGAYINLKNNVLGMDILVVLGTSAAYFYSMYLLYYQLFINNMFHPVYYFEVSALIITMVLIGNIIEQRIKTKTQDALDDLVNLGAKSARIIVNGIEQMIDIDNVKINDIVIVLANEKIPVDGCIIEGSSYIDESMITGERVPVYKKLGEKVVGGTINLQEKIIVKAKKLGEDALLNQIIATVEEAGVRKLPIQRTADKIANIFVPIVVIVSLLNFVIHFIALKDPFTFSFTTSIAILVISCPCSLGLATPTSILVGKGLAAKNQILYRGGEFFEIANKIEAIVFDKTGTITDGEFQVTNYLGDEKYLDYFYTVEKESNHPISKSMMKYAKEHNAKKLPMKNFEIIKGKGLKALVDGHKIYIGNAKIIDDFEIDIEQFRDKYQELLEEAKTINFLIIDCQAVAMYASRDKIRESSKKLIKELDLRGIKTYMITGDNKGVAKNVGKIVGIKQVCCEVVYGEKAEIIQEIQDEGFVTAFVSDGINDSLAFKQADIGISLSSGSDIAIDSSDLTLMNDDLMLIPAAIDLSSATLKNIHENFIWAFSYNLIAIPLAATGNLSMILAGVAMAFSSIMVVLNALRLKKFKFKYKNNN